MNPADGRNVNTLWCSVLVETLVRRGLRHAVVSPGSRSTPLTLALAAHPAVDAVPVLDERSAAFFALGLARGTHVPVVLVCTSGSAGAHYLPALIEAHESGVPLIVLTADRPPELRDCASGQTIDQHRLFGVYTAWYHELAVPEPTVDRLRYLRQTMRQAWDRALADGPVHLNAPFRDPLAPLPDDGTAARTAGGIDDDFYAEPGEVAVTGSPRWRLHQRVTTARGLIVAGPAQPLDPGAYARHVLALARATGWPVLADALSPLRHYSGPGVTCVGAYDVILRDPSAARDLAPRFVLALEAWPTSKVLRQWLERGQAEILQVCERPGGQDAIHGRTRRLTAAVESLVIEPGVSPDPHYAAAWAAAEAGVAGRLRTWLGSDAAPDFEGRVAWQFAQALPDGAILGVANSMPVRDLEYFWPCSDRRRRIMFSRGANGIDGTLSTALGLAHTAPAPMWLLTGDLAFLHDSNGLLLAREGRGDLTVVVINNNGGGIFGHLPVADFDPPFERYFATPQAVDLGLLCAAHNVPHELVRPGAELAALLHSPARGPGLRVVEIRTDRRADAATRKHLLRTAASGV